MSTIYLDCVSGIAGDMTLSALVDLGADESYIIEHLKQLPLDPFSMSFKTVNRRGITAKWMQLDLPSSARHGSIGHEGHDHDHGHHHGHDHDHGHHHDHHHDHHDHHDHEQDHHVHDSDDEHHGHDHHHHRAADILQMIAQSSLPERVKSRSTAIFSAIAEAEGKIHGIDPADVHFHEVGAMDSILDVIGVCLALENLGADEIIVSPIPVGHGRIRIAHGVYPIPAPATAELLRGIPLSSFTAQGELTTPTGAGIAKVLATSYGPLPEGVIERIGYGAGTKDFEHPNVLRAILLRRCLNSTAREAVTVLEAQLDDSTGEALGFAMERLFEAGALDVYHTPVFMKKNRPGVLITVLCKATDADRCEDTMLKETTTFGVRRSEWTRKALSRSWKEVSTPYGVIRVKIAQDGNRIIRQAPEYEDAAKAAREHRVSLETVFQAVYKQL